VLIEGLENLVGPELKNAQSFKAPDALMGKCETSAWIYHSNAYPFKAVGEVSFLWRPTSNCR